MKPSPAKVKRPLYKSLYFQVLVAVSIGVLLGHFYPQIGANMKPLGDGFIKLIKMIIAPIIFCTVVIGIAGMEDMKKVGKTGGLALLYFEVVSTLALIIGLVIVNLVQPGAGMNIDASTLDTKAIAAYTAPGKMTGTVDFLLNVIPSSVVDAFAKGEIRREGNRIAILAFGTLLYPALQAAEKLDATVVNMRWAKPLDTELLLQIAARHDALVTVEEGTIMGGAGSAVGEALQAAGVIKPLLQLGLEDAFIEHGDHAQLLALQGLDAAGIEASIRVRFGALQSLDQPKLALKSAA